MLINIRGEYSIIGQLTGNYEDDEFIFHDKDSHIELIIKPKNLLVKTIQQKQITKELYEALKQGISFEQHSKECQNELNQIHSGQSSFVRKTLYALKYFFNMETINEKLFAVKHVQWEQEKDLWSFLPFEIIVKPFSELIYVLSEDRTNIIQKYLDGGKWEPLFAFRHLHRAKREKDPRSKWIEATIALELAIKEVLILIEPKLEPLLLELPSPPLNVLYGKILECYSGNKSPMLSVIKKGVEKRNQILHKPMAYYINDEEAREYVNKVQYIIYYLLSLLYTEDETIKYFLRDGPY